MTSDRTLLPHVMDLKAAMARVEQQLLQLADLPSRVSALEKKVANWEGRAEGGWWVAAKAAVLASALLAAAWAVFKWWVG